MRFVLLKYLVYGIRVKREISFLRDVDVGILVPDKVDVGLREILTDELPTLAASLVVPLEATEPVKKQAVVRGVKKWSQVNVSPSVVDERHAGFVAESIGTNSSVGLGATVGTGLGPVVELKQRLLRDFFVC